MIELLHKYPQKELIIRNGCRDVLFIFRPMDRNGVLVEVFIAKDLISAVPDLSYVYDELDKAVQSFLQSN